MRQDGPRPGSEASKGGRKPGLSPTSDLKANAAVTLYRDGNPASLIMKQLGIGSKKTLYQWLRLKGVKIGQDQLPILAGKPAPAG